MSSQLFCTKPLNSDTFPCNADAITIASLGLGSGVFAMLMVLYLLRKLKQAPRGNDLMNKISDQIKSGARAFLVTEYKYLTFFIIVVFIFFIALYTADPPSGSRIDGAKYAFNFLAGAILSAAAGWGGMSVATDANVRTTQAADKQGLAVALRVAFTGGAVMGFTVVGLGLFGLSLFFFFMTLGAYDDDLNTKKFTFAAEAMAAFGFGASSIALFARVAGGIFTKAADVGADLVGKVRWHYADIVN